MRSLAVALLLAFGTVATAQNPGPAANLTSVFNFEIEPTGPIPRGWGGGPADTLFVDREVVHSGRTAARLERTASSSADD